MRLTPAEGTWYETSSLHSISAVDPISTILGELTVASVDSSGMKLMVELEHCAHDCLQALQQNPQKIPLVVVDPPSKPAAATAKEFLTAADFAKASAPRAILQFMRKLPEMYTNSGLKLVDQQGSVKLRGPKHPCLPRDVTCSRFSTIVHRSYWRRIEYRVPGYSHAYTCRC